MTLVIVLGIYALLPQDRVVIERLIESGEYARALEALEDIEPAERQRDPIYYRSTELRMKRMLGMKEPEQTHWHMLFDDALIYYRDLRGAKTVREELFKLIPMLDSVKTAAAHFDEHAAKLHLEARMPVAEALVKHALALEEQVRAAQLYRKHVMESRPSFTTLTELIHLWQLADQSEQALNDIEQFIPLLSLSEEERIQLGRLQVDLLRSLNRPSDAFNIMKAQWKEEPERVFDDAFFTLVSELATQADRQFELIPIMRKRLEADTDGREAIFRRYLDLLMASEQLEGAQHALEQEVAKDKATDKERALLAQIYEWNGEPDKAFDLYKTLALSDNTQALDRLIALNNGLYRHYELAETLEAVIAQLDDSSYRLYLARLLVEIGEYEKAAASYEDYLEALKDADPALYAELADAQKTIYAFDKAVEAYRQALRHNPSREQRIRYRKDIAWLLSLEGDYQAALDEYQQIYAQEKESDILPSILSLAHLMGKNDTYFKTIETLLEEYPTTDANLSDKEAMAKMHRADDHGAARKWREALNQYRRDLAQHYAQQGRLDEARTVLEKHTELMTNPQVFDFYLYLLASAEAFDKAITVLESPKLAPGLLRDSQTIETAAWIYDAAGRQDKALDLLAQLFERVPDSPRIALAYARMLAYNGHPGQAREIMQPLLENSNNPEIFRLAADIALGMNDYENAERYMILYLNALPQPTGEALSLLADIRLSRGDTPGAQRTYNLALRQMLRSNPELLD